MAQLKPALSRPLQRRVRLLRRHVRAARDARAHALRLLHRGRRARRRERAQDGLRLEGAPQPREGHPGRQGPAGDPLPRRPSTAAPATRCRSPTPTRARPTSSRSSPGRASRTPSLRFPRHARGRARHRGGRDARARRRSSRPSRANPDDIAAIMIEPIQAEGGDIHFRPEFLQALQRKAREHEVLLHPRRGADRRRHHRQDVGARALRAQARRAVVRQEDAGRAAAWSARAWTRSPRTSSRSPRASTRPGAAASPTWCAARASSRSSTRTRWSRTRAWSASTLLRGLAALERETGGSSSRTRAGRA